jgi:hypothetical protein
VTSARQREDQDHEPDREGQARRVQAGGDPAPEPVRVVGVLVGEHDVLVDGPC